MQVWCSHQIWYSDSPNIKIFERTFTTQINELSDFTFLHQQHIFLLWSKLSLSLRRRGHDSIHAGHLWAVLLWIRALYVSRLLESIADVIRRSQTKDSTCWIRPNISRQPWHQTNSRVCPCLLEDVWSVFPRILVSNTASIIVSSSSLWRRCNIPTVSQDFTNTGSWV